MPVSAILFDFGGTLDGEGRHWSDRFHAAYREAGMEIEREAFDRAFRAADREIERRADTGKWTLLELLAAQAHGQMEALGLDPRRLTPAVERLHAETRAALARSRELLAGLAPDYRLGILSNYAGNLATVCAEAGLLDHLAALLDSRVEGLAKPDPRFFALALERLGVAGAECAMVGDSFERDIAPARPLGMKTVWIQADPGTPCPDPKQVDHRVGTLAEVRAIFARTRV